MKKTIVLLMCIAMITAALSACNASDQVQNAAELIMDIPTVQYFTTDAVSDGDIEKILLAGINAPSAMNSQKWHFSAITDKEVLKEIADSMSMGAPGGMPPADIQTPEGEMPADMKIPEGDMQIPQGNPPADAKIPEGKPFDMADGGKPLAPTAAGAVKAGITDAPLAIVISCPDGSDFDAGLACQNMSAEATLLGYGTKILSSATIALNGERKAEFDEVLGIPERYSAAAVLLVGKEDTSVDKNTDTYAGATGRNPFDEVVTYIK